MIKLPAGFLFSGINCGIKKGKLDLGLIYCNSFAKAAGFFTKNKNQAYSVTASKINIKNPIKAILANSGNANCFSHKDGLKDTKEIMSKLAESLGVKEKNILIASTGIIGKRMPKEKIINGFDSLVASLGKDIFGFSQSIMTTDTFKKIASADISVKNGYGSILGFSKGAGMIAPNMATMLAFVVTDVDIGGADFKKIAKQAVEESFNSITVDGCMSTNDTLFFLSSGQLKLKDKKEMDAFGKKIKQVCLDLAKMMVRDGEGATKFIEIDIKGAKTKEEARKAGLFIANSNLFKCAVYGANPNWGRIIAALGHAGIGVSEDVSIRLSDLKKKQILINVDLKRGKHAWKVYTSDLTPEYIKINAEYS